MTNIDVKKQISDAWACLRQHNQAIPDEVLDDFKRVLNEHYSQVSSPFDPQQLHEYYSNIKPVNDSNQAHYAVFDGYGNQTGNIIYMGSHEWRYLLDNFPADKRFYSNNLPVTTREQFEADVLRTGLLLVQK